MRRFIPVLLLFGISLLILSVNFIPGVWMTGWDNLHPEFNFSLNLQRSIFSVWQEYQGLGLLGGMGHAADLPRQLILWIFSAFISVQYLRFFWIGWMLIIGPIGVYFFLLSLLQSEDDATSLSSDKRQLEQVAAFLAGAFYLLNLATVQIFYVPFEAFVTHYGFLPWLLYISFRCIKTGGVRNYLFFAVISILSMTASYVPTLFLVYIMALFLFLFGYVASKFDLLVIKRIGVLFLLTFLINAFWLLPFSYFTLTSAGVVGQAHENFMSTEDVFLRNKEFGRLTDVALLKGFWFKFVDMGTDRQFYYMVTQWRNHINIPLVKSVGFILFGFVLLGLLKQFAKPNKTSLGLIFLFFLPVTFLANDTPLFAQFGDLVRESIPLFAQVFRVPFTKFSILAAFSYSILFGYGFLFFSYLLGKKFNISKKRCISLAILFFGMFLMFTFPVFKGDFFYNFEKLSIPPEYSQTMQFFQHQKNIERIANFPQSSYWGWNHFTWGYRGSGFLWYGIEQPILDRAFDGFSRLDENYYWELSNALYSKKPLTFAKVLEKYQINWLVVDGNVLPTLSGKALFLDTLDEFINSSPKYSLEATYGKIKIYHVSLDSQPENFVFLAHDLPTVQPSYTWNNYDRAFVDNGNYVSPSGLTTTTVRPPIIFYPFRSFFTGHQQEELEFSISDRKEYYSFQSQIPKNLQGSNFIIPAVQSDEVSQIHPDDLSKKNNSFPQFFLDGELINWPENGSTISAQTKQEIPLPYISTGNLEVRIPKEYGYYSFDSLWTNELFRQTPNNCDKFNNGEFSQKSVRSGDTAALQFTSISASNCIDLDLTSLSHKVGYLIAIESKNIEGKSLLFSVVNKTTQHIEIETNLPKQADNHSAISYFIMPPTDTFGLGYILHFDNISIGRVKTINELGRVVVQPIPYRLLTSLKIIKGEPAIGSQLSVDNMDEFEVSHPNPSVYSFVFNSFNYQISTSDYRFLVLSQGYDKGWKAYRLSCQLSAVSCQLKSLLPFLFFPEIKDHILVNNWENGWIVNNLTMKPFDKTQDKQFNNETIIIVYLPQYLEYVGFGLMALVIISGGFQLLRSFRSDHSLHKQHIS